MKKYNGISYLKLLLTTFVVAHHAFLAFTPSGGGSPIHDSNTTIFYSYVILLFDNFFMFTFFFISGLFAVRSLQNKGPRKYLLNRFIRLGVVFIIAAYSINIIGFYMMEVFKDVDPFFVFGFSNFLEYYNFVATNSSPAAHLWFLWVLLLFNIIFVLISPLISKGESLSKLISKNPKVLFGIMFGLGILLYSLTTQIFGYNFITIFGPFTLQIGRVTTYFAMYIIGILFGKNGIKNTFIYDKSKSSMQFVILIVTGVVSGIIFSYLLIHSQWTILSNIGDLLTVVIFTSLTIGLVTLFMRYVNGENRFLLLLADHAFMIYILHYAVISTIQGIFYNVDINGLLEGILVFILGYGLTIVLAYVLRKIPIIRKVT